MRAVNELGYVPNGGGPQPGHPADQLGRAGRLRAPDRVFSDDPMFSTVIRSASIELEAVNKQVVLMLAGSPESHARVETYIAGGHVDGVMLMSIHGADPLPVALTRLRVPVVSYGRPAVPVAHAVRRQRQRGRRRRGRAPPAGAGRRRIATIAGPLDMIGGQDRLDRLPRRAP